MGPEAKKKRNQKKKLRQKQKKVASKSISPLPEPEVLPIQDTEPAIVQQHPTQLLEVRDTENSVDEQSIGVISDQASEKPTTNSLKTTLDKDQPEVTEKLSVNDANAENISVHQSTQQPLTPDKNEQVASQTVKESKIPESDQSISREPPEDPTSDVPEVEERVAETVRFESILDHKDSVLEQFVEKEPVIQEGSDEGAKSPLTKIKPEQNDTATKTQSESDEPFSAEQEEKMPWEGQTDQEDFTVEPHQAHDELFSGGDDGKMPWEKQQSPHSSTVAQASTEKLGFPETTDDQNNVPQEPQDSYTSVTGTETGDVASSDKVAEVVKEAPSEEIEELFGGESEKEKMPWEVNATITEQLVVETNQENLSPVHSQEQRQGQDDRVQDEESDNLFTTSVSDTQTVMPWEEKESSHHDFQEQEHIAEELDETIPKKKFSFLEEDDDLLDDDDSFLDSDEDIPASTDAMSENSTVQDAQNTAPVAANQQTAPGTLPVQNSHVPSQPSHSKYAPSQDAPTFTASQQQFASPDQPVSKKINYLPANVGATHTQGQSINAYQVRPNIIVPAPQIQPSFTGVDSVANVDDTVYKKIDEMKKKSDAYDFPIDLVPVNPKAPVHARPVGVPTPSLTPGTPRLGTPTAAAMQVPVSFNKSRTFSASSSSSLPKNQKSLYAEFPVASNKPTRAMSTRVAHHPSTSVTSPSFNPPGMEVAPFSSMTGPLKKASKKGSVSALPPNPYAPPQISEEQKLEGQKPFLQQGIVPPQVNLPVKNGPPSSPFPSIHINQELPTNHKASLYTPTAQTARMRAFSNASIGSNGSYGNSATAANPYAPPALLQQQAQHQNGGFSFPPNVSSNPLSSTAPLPNLPALQTVGLNNMSQPALSPGSQRRTHARSNSSVYAPAYAPHASKYAPTVQPQFQQQFIPQSGSVPQHSNQYTAGYLPQQNAFGGASYPSSAQPQSYSLKASLASQIPSTIPEPLVSSEHLMQRQFPIFHWGKSSKVVYALPSGVDDNNYMMTNNRSIQCVHVSGYDTILKPPSVLKGFPGPLAKNKAKTKDLEKWMESSIDTLSKERPSDDHTLWSVLKLKLSPTNNLKSIAKALYDSDELLPFLSQPNMTTKTGPNAFKLVANDQLRILAYLQTGGHEQALELAFSHKDYALALILSSLLGKEKWSEVVDRYLHDEFQNGGVNGTSFSVNLLALIFQVFVGNSKRVIQEFRNDPSKEMWALQNWKMILAAVLNNSANSNETSSETSSATEIDTLSSLIVEFLVDFGILLLQKGLVTAGTISLVIANIPLSTNEIIPQSNVKFQHIGSVNSLEGAILSEVYEHTFSIRDSKFTGFTCLIPQKLLHASALADYGLTAAASKYTDMLASVLRSLPKSSLLAVNFAYQLDIVTSRLSGSGSGWLGKPKLSSVWGQLDKSFNKFIGGDDDEVLNSATEKKVFDNFTPSASRNASMLDLSQQFTPISGGVAPLPPLQRIQSDIPIQSKLSAYNPSIPDANNHTVLRGNPYTPISSEQSNISTRKKHYAPPKQVTTRHSSTIPSVAKFDACTPGVTSQSVTNSPHKNTYSTPPVFSQHSRQSSIPSTTSTPPPIFSGLNTKNKSKYVLGAGNSNTSVDQLYNNLATKQGSPRAERAKPMITGAPPAIPQKTFNNSMTDLFVPPSMPIAKDYSRRSSAYSTKSNESENNFPALPPKLSRQYTGVSDVVPPPKMRTNSIKNSVNLTKSTSYTPVVSGESSTTLAFGIKQPSAAPSESRLDTNEIEDTINSENTLAVNRESTSQGTEVTLSASRQNHEHSFADKSPSEISAEYDYTQVTQSEQKYEETFPIVEDTGVEGKKEYVETAATHDILPGIPHNTEQEQTLQLPLDEETAIGTELVDQNMGLSIPDETLPAKIDHQEPHMNDSLEQSGSFSEGKVEGLESEVHEETQYSPPINDYASEFAVVDSAAPPVDPYAEQSSQGSNSPVNRYAPNSTSSKGQHRTPYIRDAAKSEDSPHFSPYTPKNLTPMPLSQNPGANTQDEEINMFAYGGYKTPAFNSNSEQGPGMLNPAQDRAKEEQPVDQDLIDHQIVAEEPILAQPKPVLHNSESRFDPIKKAHPSSDGAFTPMGAPVIRLASNPNFKPYTPSTSANLVEYYDDVVEDESDEENEEEQEKKREEEEEKKRKEEETKKRKQEEKKKRQEEKDKKKNDEHGGSGWFGWLRKENNEKKPVKAKLGHQNTFFYDENLKRWVNKNATDDEKQQVATPPPPPPVIKRKTTDIPETKPRSGSTAGGAASRTASIIAPSNPLTGKPLLSHHTPNETEGISDTISPPLTANKSVNLSSKKANGLDDLISLTGGPSAGTNTRRKKKPGRGYVNVMTNI